MQAHSSSQLIFTNVQMPHMCSALQVITDLLNPSATRLAVRETLSDGVTVVGASEVPVQDGALPS